MTYKLVLSCMTYFEFLSSHTIIRHLNLHLYLFLICPSYVYTACYPSLPAGWFAWAWLAKAKGLSCHTKISTLATTFTEKTSKSAKQACHYATKKS